MLKKILARQKLVAVWNCPHCCLTRTQEIGRFRWRSRMEDIACIECGAIIVRLTTMDMSLEESKSGVQRFAVDSCIAEVRQIPRQSMDVNPSTSKAADVQLGQHENIPVPSTTTRSQLRAEDVGQEVTSAIGAGEVLAMQEATHPDDTNVDGVHSDSDNNIEPAEDVSFHAEDNLGESSTGIRAGKSRVRGFLSKFKNGISRKSPDIPDPILEDEPVKNEEAVPNTLYVHQHPLYPYTTAMRCLCDQSCSCRCNSVGSIQVRPANDHHHSEPERRASTGQHITIQEAPIPIEHASHLHRTIFAWITEESTGLWSRSSSRGSRGRRSSRFSFTMSRAGNSQTRTRTQLSDSSDGDMVNGVSESVDFDSRTSPRSV